MIRKIVMLLAVVFTFSSCTGQEKEKKENESQPKTNVVVNKEYDDNGNLIKYDSTYSYYYSNIEKDTFLMDSILNDFKGHFNENFYFSNRPYFNDLFFDDSLMGYDFYKSNFFLNRYKTNMERMQNLFMEMDSIKNKFFKNQFNEFK